MRLMTAIANANLEQLLKSVPRSALCTGSNGPNIFPSMQAASILPRGMYYHMTAFHGSDITLTAPDVYVEQLLEFIQNLSDGEEWDWIVCRSREHSACMGFALHPRISASSHVLLVIAGNIIYMFTYVYIQIYLHIYMHIYVHIYIHIYTHIHASRHGFLSGPF